MQQSDFNSELKTQNSEPKTVECLGMTFDSDEARREHFIELLREKLKDPEFRKIEGFPIGEDEDILNLSDPPYYTACPNPWIGEYIKHYGKPYDPKEKYHREPFAADVSEGKNHPIYNAHSYHTKVPHRAIMRYILHYTEPGDVVFDGFCGTGMTGVAAELCGDRKEVEALGYRIADDGRIFDEEGRAFSKLGSRRVILNELSPAASSIADGYMNFFGSNNEEFLCDAKRLVESVTTEVGSLYETEIGGKAGRIKYVVWSDCFSCAECGKEIVFWNEAVDEDAGTIASEFNCPECGCSVKKSSLERVYTTVYDGAVGVKTKKNKQVPVVIRCDQGTRKGTDSDLRWIRKLEESKPTRWFPINRMMNCSEDVIKWGDKWRAGTSNFVFVHEIYTRRNLDVLASFWEAINRMTFLRHRTLMRFIFTATCMRHSLMNTFRFNVSFPSNVTLGTLYIASLAKENNYIDQFWNKAKRRVTPLLRTGRRAQYAISTGSATDLRSCPDESLDYLFVDPPFGENFAYAELNFSWEAWLKLFTNSSPEAIVSSYQKKGLGAYASLMRVCFREFFRVLKPGRWMTVEFSNTKAVIWNAIQSSLQEVGFIVANVAALDKNMGSFNAVNTSTAVKQDLVISAYKPNGGLEKRFAKHGDSVEGVWDFLQTHLRNLPVVKAKGGQLEPIPERDPRILYDRMVAFYVGHNTPVPLSSGEFQAELAERYPMRDGMVFLAEQVSEYDKKAAQMEHVGQMSIFVEDEKSAINWLRQYLKDRPSTYQDIHPEFMQQLSSSWKKWETRPELSLLLDQNFIKYGGEGDVSSQIHSYLSTNFKELRGKAKDDPALKSKAKDRWYVPDPKKAVDVEAVRDKRLLAEFWAYAAEAGVSRPKPGDPNQTTLQIPQTPAKKTKVRKLKEVRTEAIRIGFLECHRNKDAATILAVAQILPNNVIEEDEQLQMIYDMAEMRAGE